MSANNVTQQLAHVAGVVRSWIAANWDTKTAAVSAAATAAGVALVCLWNSDFARQYYTNKLLGIGLEYDRLMTKRKRQQLSELESVKDARGDGRLIIVEIGCGGGTNLKYYPTGSEIICVEPNGLYEETLYDTARQHPGLQISAFLISSAENMREVESESVDAVISTVVLCSVGDPNQCLKEIIRVLKPGGEFFFMEHVMAPRQFYIIRFFQVLLDFLRVWPMMYDGCHLTRSTEDNTRKSGFSSVDVEEFEAHELMPMGGPVRLVRSHISGTATK